MQLSADYTTQSASYEQAKSQAAELARQLSAAQQRCEALGAECDARTSALEGARARLQEALAAQTTSCQQWEAQQAALQVGPSPCVVPFRHSTRNLEHHAHLQESAADIFSMPMVPAGPC